MRLTILALLLAALQGCATNPYVAHYTAVSLSHGLSYEPVAGGPRLVRGTDVRQDRIVMLEDGYAPLGYSSFDADRANETEAVKQANAIGASVVLVYSRASGTLPAGRPPLGAAPGGSASDYFATYWRKVRPGPFGVVVREPDAEERRRIGGNAGLVVVAVRKGSPAFDAHLLRGDVIEKIGDAAIHDGAELTAALRRYAGQSAAVELLRGGKRMTQQVAFGAAH